MSHWRDAEIAAACQESRALKDEARERRRARILKLHADGMTNREIAESMGIGDGAVAKVLREAGKTANVHDGFRSKRRSA